MILSPEQLQAVEQARQANWQHIFWWKVGTGKTRLALACVEQSPATSCWIICPRKACETWQDEISLCNFTIPHHIISADSLHKVNWNQDFSKTFLIVDELYYFATGNSKRSKQLRPRVLRFPCRVGLSGTIMPAQNNETIWWQLENLKLDHRLAPTLTSFREHYRKSILSHFTIGGGRRLALLENKPDSEQEIVRRVQKVTHTYFPKNEDRKIRHQIINCTLTPQQLAAIEQVKKEFQLKLPSGEILDYTTAMEILFTVCKITNGWIDDTNNTTYPSNKLTRLESILETLHADNKQSVIWCMFRKDIQFLTKSLPYKTLTFFGGQPFDTAKWKTGQYPFILATCASGASVNYFGNVEYAIFYSLPLKLTEFIQAKGRHERKSSTHGGAFYYYLLTKSPALDQHLYKLLEDSNKDEQKIILHLANIFLDRNQNT